MRKLRSRQKNHFFKTVVVFVLCTLFISVGYSLLSETFSVSGKTNITAKYPEPDDSENLVLTYRRSTSTSGYTYSFTLTNEGTKTVNDWSIDIPLSTSNSVTASSASNATFTVTGSGSSKKLHIVPKAATKVVEPGKSVTFSVKLNRSLTLSNWVINELSYADPVPETIATSKNLILKYTKEELFVGLFAYDFILTNQGTEDVYDWSINIPVSSGVKFVSSSSDINASLNGGNLHITPTDNNSFLERGDEIEFHVLLDANIPMTNTNLQEIEPTPEDISNSQNLVLSYIKHKIGSGRYEYEFVVTNIGNKAVYNWSADIPVPSGTSIVDYDWAHASINGNTLHIMPYYDIKYLEPGDVVTFYVVLDENTSLTNADINEPELISNTQNLVLSYIETEVGDQYIYDFVLKNVGTETVYNFSIDIPVPSNTSILDSDIDFAILEGTNLNVSGCWAFQPGEVQTFYVVLDKKATISNTSLEELEPIRSQNLVLMYYWEQLDDSNYRYYFDIENIGNVPVLDWSIDIPVPSNTNIGDYFGVELTKSGSSLHITPETSYTFLPGEFSSFYVDFDKNFLITDGTITEILPITSQNLVLYYEKEQYDTNQYFYRFYLDNIGNETVYDWSIDIPMPSDITIIDEYEAEFTKSGSNLQIMSNGEQSSSYLDPGGEITFGVLLDKNFAITDGTITEVLPFRSQNLTMYYEKYAEEFEGTDAYAYIFYLINEGTDIVYNWAADVQVPPGSTIFEALNADFTINGTNLHISPYDYNSYLEPGDEAELIVLLDKNFLISSVSVEEKEVPIGSSDNLLLSYKKTAVSPGTYRYTFILSNEGTETVNNWAVGIPIPYFASSNWDSGNVDFTIFGGMLFVVPKDDTLVIDPGDTITFEIDIDENFTISEGFIEEMEPEEPTENLVLTYTRERTSTYSSTYKYTFTLSNEGTKIVNDWSISIPLSTTSITMSSKNGAEFVRSGSTLNITPNSTTKTVTPGNSVTFSVNINKSLTLSNWVINELSYAEPEPSDEPIGTSENLALTYVKKDIDQYTHIYTFTLTNEGSETVDNWSIALPTPFNVYINNTAYVDAEYDNGYIYMTPWDEIRSIDPGDSVIFGIMLEDDIILTEAEIEEKELPLATSENLELTYIKSYNGSNNYGYTFNLKNVGNETVDEWSIDMLIPSGTSMLTWEDVDATILDDEDLFIMPTFHGYNRILEPGDEISFFVSLDDDFEITDAYITEIDSLIASSNNLTLTYVRSMLSDNYMYTFTLTNDGSEIVEDWSIAIPVPSGTSFIFSEDSDASVRSNVLNINPLSSNQTLEPGDEVTFNVTLNKIFEMLDADIEEDVYVSTPEIIAISQNLMLECSKQANNKFSFTITNTGDTAIDDWSADINLSTAIGISSEVNVTTSTTNSGRKIHITPSSNIQLIDPGKSKSFSITMSSSMNMNNISSATINELSYFEPIRENVTSSDNLVLDVIKTGGATFDFVLTNDGTKIVNDWTIDLKISTGLGISSFSNINLTLKDSRHTMHIEPKSNIKVVEPGDSVRFSITTESTMSIGNIIKSTSIINELSCSEPEDPYVFDPTVPVLNFSYTRPQCSSCISGVSKYVITLTNNGTKIVNNWALDISLPSDTTYFQGINSSSFTLTKNGNSYHIVPKSEYSLIIPPGGKMEIDLQFKGSSDIIDHQISESYAMPSSGNHATNNLSVAFQRSSMGYPSGDITYYDYTYYIHVVNSGSSTISNGYLQFYLPEGAAILTTSPSGYTFTNDNGHVTVTLNKSLAPGEYRKLIMSFSYPTSNGLGLEVG